MKRLNITLPERVAEAIEVYQNKSKFIAKAIIEKIKKDNEEKLDALLIEGYKNSLNDDKKINQEWEDAALERWPD
ncbi:MAG: ribbon-helix-helix domain-containing protein [Actinobacteria bacterium]|nr:ribbon-helix-helix domain-containing protein [Actinomycetota bacterium]